MVYGVPIWTGGARDGYTRPELASTKVTNRADRKGQRRVELAMAYWRRCCLIGMLSCLGLAISVWAQAPNRDANEAWFVGIADQVYETLMPMKSDAGLLVAYRAYDSPALDATERYFAVRVREGYGYDRDKLVGTLVRSRGRSIESQMLTLRANDTQAPVSVLLSRLTLQRGEFYVEDCPALRTQMNALSRVRISVPERDRFAIHPVKHRVVLGLFNLRMDATLLEQTDPLVQWAVRTSEMFSACVPG